MGTKSTPGYSMSAYRNTGERVGLTNDDAIDGHVLARDLKPSTRSGAKIDAASSRFEKCKFFIELN